MTQETHKRLIARSILWRIMGIIILAAVVYFYTRNLITTTYITFVHHATFLFVFYLHDRVWLKIKAINGISRKIIRAITYEVILGMGIGGTIVLLFTGSWSSVTRITITYTIIKLITYVLYDVVWNKIKWGQSE